MQFRAAGSFLKTLILITIPAIISIWLSYRLFDIAMNEKSVLAWVTLFLAAPFTIFFTFLALVFNFLSLMAALLLIAGRRSTNFRVFTNMGNIDDIFVRPPRDVTPDQERSEPRDVTPTRLRVLKEPET